MAAHVTVPFDRNIIKRTGNAPFAFCTLASRSSPLTLPPPPRRATREDVKPLSCSIGSVPKQVAMAGLNEMQTDK